MKTPTRDTSQHTALPPAPAPTAPDANPWTISSQSRAPGSKGEAARPAWLRPAVSGRNQEAVAPDWLRPKSPKVPPEARRPDRGSGPASVLPIVVTLFVFAAAFAGVAEALARGDVVGAIGPMLVGAFAVLIALRRARRRR